MDLRAALSALRARWWVLVLTTALTVGLGVALTFLHPRAYVATSTYEVAPRPALGGEAGSARQSEIAETFAQIAMSSYVAEAVHRDLGLVADAPLATIESQVRPGTTVLEVSARAGNPWLASKYANATGRVLLDYLEGVNDAFRLVPLDGAKTATPEPSGLVLNVALGLVVGLALGAGLVLAVPWPRGLGRPQPPEIVDSESVDDNRAYFAMRWTFAPLVVGILFLLMGLAVPIMAGDNRTRLGGPPELFGVPFGGMEPFLLAGGITLLVMALAGAVREIRSDRGDRGV